MTIKNLKKNISDEDGIVNVSVEANTLTVNNSSKNFSNNCEITFAFQDWENEDAWEDRANNYAYPQDTSYKWNSTKKVYIKKITLPSKDLVRLEHLTEYYYDKAYINQYYYTAEEIDKKIKVNFYVWGTTTPPTVAQVKALQTNGTIESYDNYIFLVPYETNYNNDNSDETYQEGGFREFRYIKNGTQESMEEVGSMKIDLTPYLETSELEAELKKLAQTTYTYKNVVDQVYTNKTNIDKKVDKDQTTANAFVYTNSSKQISLKTRIDKLDINGYLYTTTDGTTKATNKILTTDTNGLISPVNNIGTNKILNSTALNSSSTGGITADTSKTQNDINGLINTALVNLNSKFGNYLLKNDIKKEIWGEGPNRIVAKQNADTDTAKTYKLGDYLYYLLYEKGEFYTASQIDGFIGNVINIQDNTLRML